MQNRSFYQQVSFSIDGFLNHEGLDLKSYEVLIQERRDRKEKVGENCEKLVFINSIDVLSHKCSLE